MHRLFAKSIVLVVGLVVMGCTPIVAPTPEAAEEAASSTETIILNISAAASLTDAFNEIGEGFAAANPGTEVVNNYAGSNALATQIAEGAPVDVFASANTTQMNNAVDSGRIDADAPQIFVHNRLVVVTPADNPAGLTDLEDLATPGVKIVLANEEVPVGQYSLDFLDKADAVFGPGYKDAVLANVVSYEEDVRAVLTKIELGEADAGIVYTSDAGTSDAVGEIQIPDDLNTIADYPIATLNDSANAELAQGYVEYVLGPEGQAVLAEYGFIPVIGASEEITATEAITQ